VAEASHAIFLSYASEDAEAARRICDGLRAAGIEVWFDQSELRGGEAWDKSIRQQIKACALFIPVISQNSHARMEGYFRLEWKLAVDRSHLMAAEKNFLLPVVIDDVSDSDAGVPDRFREVQWSALPGGETPREFIERVSRLLVAQTVGAPRPAVSHVRHAPLGHTVGTLPPLEKSIAVLPFSNLSSDKENEYFGDGLAEEILNALSHIPELRVAARTSTFSLKNKGLSVSEIGGRLHVATVLDGSVRRAADRLRITVQMVDVQNGFHLWSERYDRQLSDVFEIQDEIAQAVARQLRVTLASVDTRPTANVEAYELYLRGRYAWHQRSPTTMRAAIKDFEQSLKLDPNNALAFAGLADCYVVLTFYGWMPPGDARGPAYEAMQRAVALAPNLWETNFSRGLYIFTFERAWRSAEPYFEKAAALSPRVALAHTYFGLFLAVAGKADEAVAQADLGSQLDPLSPLPRSMAAVAYKILGRLEAAESAARQALDLQADFLPALWELGRILCTMQRSEEAVPYFERAVQLSRAPWCVGWLGLGLACAGQADEARRLLSELDERGSRGEFIPPLVRLQIHSGLGDVAAIRTAFAAAIEIWTPPLPIRFAVDLEPFRTDPDIDRMWRELFGS
jgi:TolB-like protein/Tfp pilus assembly protein PilF